MPSEHSIWLPTEETLLESGQKLKHHIRANCSGGCCLHGTSRYASCKMPRQWRNEKGILEHVCPHDVGHPCRAGLDYAEVMGQHHDGGIHDCDGCCAEEADMTAAPDWMEQIDDRPPSPERRLAAVEAGLATNDVDLEIQTQWLTDLEIDIDDLQRRQMALSWLYLLTIIAFGILLYFR